MIDPAPGDVEDVEERDLESPLGSLRNRLANINELTQREVDYVFARLRAAREARNG